MANMEIKDVVEILIAALTPLIAILAVYIAYQQYKVNHHALRNQLYERRYRVFEATMAYLAEIMRHGKTDFRRVGQFYAETSEAEFLFTEKVTDHLELLYQKGIDLEQLGDKLFPPDGSQGVTGEERGRVAKEKGDLFKWFNAQLQKTRDVFRSEMKVG